MKLFKKLLPLVTIGATACTIAPIATSCNKSDAIYTVKFDVDGGTKVEDQKAVEGQLLHEPTTAKNGYEFVAWMNGDKVWDFAKDKVTGPMTLKATWLQLPEGSPIDLLTFNTDTIKQHEATKITEAGEEGYKKAAKMYFKDEDPQIGVIDRVKNDILVKLSTDAKLLEISKIVDPTMTEGMEWVGKINSATAYIKTDNVEYQDNTKNALLTGTITLTLTADYINENKEKIGNYLLVTKHTLDKVPYYIIDWDQSEHYWTVKTDATILKATAGWKLTRTYYGIAVNNSTGKVEDETNTKFWEQSSSEMPTKENLDPITWDSTYMDTVEHGK